MVSIRSTNIFPCNRQPQCNRKVVDQTLSQNKKNQINQSSQESSETYLKEFWFKTWVTFNVILQFQMNFYMLLDFWPVVNSEDLITYNKPNSKKRLNPKQTILTAIIEFPSWNCIALSNNWNLSSFDVYTSRLYDLKKNNIN